MLVTVISCHHFRYPCKLSVRELSMSQPAELQYMTVAIFRPGSCHNLFEVRPSQTPRQAEGCFLSYCIRQLELKWERPEGVSDVTEHAISPLWADKLPDTPHSGHHANPNTLLATPQFGMSSHADRFAQAKP